MNNVEFDDENEHHLFSFFEVKYHLLQVYGVPKNPTEERFIEQKANNIWRKMPKFRIKKSLHTELHQNRCPHCGVNTSSFQQRIQNGQKEELNSKIRERIESLKPATRRYVCKNGVLHNDEVVIDASEFKSQILKQLGFESKTVENGEC